MKPKEQGLVKQILDYLAYLPDTVAYRQNAGGFVRPQDGARQAFYRFVGIDGISDIIGCLGGKYGGRYLAIEVKVGKNKLSEKQQEFLNKIKRCGGIAIVAYSLDDVIAGLSA